MQPTMGFSKIWPQNKRNRGEGNQPGIGEFFHQEERAIHVALWHEGATRKESSRRWGAEKGGLNSPRGDSSCICGCQKDARRDKRRRSNPGGRKTSWIWQSI